jgi:hypothetical protein
VVTFDGTSWSKPSAVDPGSYLQAVSCASASFCVAIDRKGNAFTCPASNFCAAVDGAGGNVVTFDGTSWTTPVTLDSKAASSVSGPVLVFLMSVSCLSAQFCVAGDSTGDAFVRR